MEIVIVDDHSDPDTRSVIKSLRKEDEQIRCVQHERNRGLPAARNTGIRNSKGDYILFGEDDVVFPPDYTAVLLDHLKRAGCDIIAGRLVSLARNQTRSLAVKDADTFRGPLIDYHTLIGNFQKKVKQDTGVPFLHACALFKKSVFHSLMYDEKIFKRTYFREETDFYVNALNKGFRMVFCPYTSCFHLPHEPSQHLITGCRPKSSIKASFWKQRNNASFLLKNRRILSEELDLDYRRLFLELVCSSARNALHRLKTRIRR